MVNKALAVNDAGLPAPARRILDQLPFPVQRARKHSRAVAVEYRKRIGSAEAREAARGAPGVFARRLIVADRSTAAAREVLARHGIGVVDAQGNARIEFPGFYVLREIRSLSEPRRRARLSGKAGVVAQALLLEPKRAWRVQDAAERAGVSPALAHRVLARLDHVRLLRVEGVGPHRVRFVADPSALLELWAEEDADRSVNRVRAHRLARSPQELVASLSGSLQRGRVAHAVSGAAAANLIAPFVTAVPVVDVWVEGSSDLASLLSLVGAGPAEEGHNVVLQQSPDDVPLAFRRREGGAWLANPLRIYRDLRRDPRRGREQADHLRRAAIGF